MYSLSIIGAGKLGKTLGKLFYSKGVLNIYDVLCTNMESAENAVSFIGCGNPVSQFKQIGFAEIFLISTPDDLIEEVASKVADKYPDSVIFHCSGSLSSEIINAKKKCSIHPVHSFANPMRSVKNFKNTMCGVEGDNKALDMLIPVFEKIGARIFKIKTDKKPLYHAAAAMACNYFVTLEHIATSMFKDCGLDENEIINLLFPILNGTLNNLKENGTVNSLTGPISRGDFNVIKKHIEVIEQYDETVLVIYKKLGLKALEMASKQNFASKDNIERIYKILEK